MKYISVLFFAVALAWTWHVVHSKPEVSFETHSGVQEKLAELIKASLLAKKPEATEFVIEKIWTETITATKLKTYFIYSFKETTEEGPITNRIEGSGFLEKKESLENENESNHWVFSNFVVGNDVIEFGDSSLVTVSAKDLEGSAPSDSSKESSTEGTQDEITTTSTTTTTTSTTTTTLPIKNSPKKVNSTTTTSTIPTQNSNSSAKETENK